MGAEPWITEAVTLEDLRAAFDARMAPADDWQPTPDMLEGAWGENERAWRAHSERLFQKMAANYDDRLGRELAAWREANPDGSFQGWQVFLRERSDRETTERAAKEGAQVRTMRELFAERAGKPAELAALYRQMFGPRRPRNDVEHEYAAKWVGAMLPEVLDAMESAPRKQVYKPELDKVVNYDGPRKDRSAEPYWDQVPAGVRVAVAEGRCKPIDEAVAAIVWQHNRRVYRAVKDKTRRIKVIEIATLLGHKTKKMAQKSISRMLKEQVMLVEAAGLGSHNGAIYTFPARESEHAQESSGVLSRADSNTVKGPVPLSRVRSGS